MLMDANARTGKEIEGERTEDDVVLGTYGRNGLNDNGKRLLEFATDNELAVTNTLFFSTRKRGISHTYNGVVRDRAGDFKRIDYILTLQVHRPRVHNVEAPPQPNRPIKADSDNNMVFATVDLGGRIAHNQPSYTANTATPAIRQKKPAEDGIPPGASDLEVRRHDG